MAARWKFYVYELTDQHGVVRYVGKGSGRRLRVQMRGHALAGHEVARFKREADAYSFEVTRIAECQPERNTLRGGNGPRTKRAGRPAAWEAEMDRIGTRTYAARFLLARAAHLMDPSKVDGIRRVADGQGV